MAGPRPDPAWVRPVSRAGCPPATPTTIRTTRSPPPNGGAAHDAAVVEGRESTTRSPTTT
ncbi:hypothetical protein HBB16_00045 [Pseudonocardia sp. MCCB 268]|nr:hypothetical protein [Pseudonocardia cytotoxica]